MRRIRPRIDLVEVEELVATMSEVERRLARRELGSDPAELDVLELEALVDLALEREVA